MITITFSQNYCLEKQILDTAQPFISYWGIENNFKNKILWCTKDLSQFKFQNMKN